MNLLKYVIGFSAALVLTACGGGGGNSGTVSGSSDTGGSTSGGTTVTTSPTMTVQLFNSANTSVTSVTYADGNYVKATLKSSAGAAVSGKLITFSLGGATVAVFPSGSTALTNGVGEATVRIDPASVAAVGAGTVTASAAADAVVTAVSASFDFGVSAANSTIDAIQLGSTTLSAGGNTPVSTVARINGTAAAGVIVAFSADCGTITSPITSNGSGIASGTYSAVKTDGTSCSGTVTVSASAAGASSQSASLTVTAPVADAINFVSATPNQIFVKGSGAAEQSIVKFKVLSNSGVAMPNVPVVFSLTQNPGGVGLKAAGVTAAVTETSDANGDASLSVFSGTIPGPVEVKAALERDASVFTVSKNLTVASGPPSQNHFSLSAETFNIEGFDYDGTSTTLTVRVADRQGNPVQDGTVINFVAEGGQVAPSCATVKTNGIAACSALFVSQSPRPGNGRVSVLAFAEGLKEYTDVNQNNVYDSGTDTLVDIGDAYRDDDEDGVHDSGEFVIAKGGTTACVGVGAPYPAKIDTCSGAAVSAATVRQQMVLLFSSSDAAFTVVTPATSDPNTFVDVRVNSGDNALLPMPAGTTISASTVATGCTVGTVEPGVVLNVAGGVAPLAQLGTVHRVPLTGCAGVPVSIKASTPKGNVTVASYSVPTDATAPTVTSAAVVESITATGATLTATINEAGTGHYKIQLAAAAAPSAAGVVSTGTSFAMLANTPAGVLLTGLTAATNYTLYFAAKDVAGNITSLSAVSFSTP